MITPPDRDLIFSHVDFTPLVGKRILMTGGTGFVGRWMSVVPDGVTVTALNHMEYELQAWDLERWDYIIHLANTTPRRVIDCARKHDTPILYASSGATTDRYPQAYAIGKLQAEQDLLESWANVRIARMYTFCGAYMKNRYAVINYITDAITGHSIKIRGGHNVIRTYLYAADMAVWMWRILLKGKRGTTYAVGADHQVTMWELAQEVQKHFNHPMIEDELIYSDERPVYVPETLKTKSECGVEVYTPFEEAIRRTVAHYVGEYQMVR